MDKKEKKIDDNQWVSTPVESKIVTSSSKKNKTETDNQWTSTSKNPIK